MQSGDAWLVPGCLVQVQSGNLVDLVCQCCSLDAPDVRQGAFALLGDLAKVRSLLPCPAPLLLEKAQPAPENPLPPAAFPPLVALPSRMPGCALQEPSSAPPADWGISSRVASGSACFALMSRADVS